MKVEIKGGTVALAHLDDAIENARLDGTPSAVLAFMRASRGALALAQPEPTPEQERAWGYLTPRERKEAAHECMAKVPAVLTVTYTEGVATGAPVRLKWEVRRGG